jgi:hypothetical protein
MQDLWTCSAPAERDDYGCYFEETFTSGESKTGNNFGNYLLPESVVTDSSLCMFGEDFRVLFTPDGKNWPEYKISATNSGQFFYNVFYAGTVGEDVTFDITLPYPFVTKGANPIHGYKTLTVYEDLETGYTCLMPGEEFFVDSTQVTLADYAPQAYGSSTEISVGVNVPDSGFIYLAIHLEYGLIGSNNYLASGDDAIDADTNAVLVPNQYEHIFSYEAYNGNDVSHSTSIYNLNVFKSNPGVGGLTYEPLGEYFEVYGEEDVTVRLIIPKSVRGVSDPWLEAIPDADGWYMINYMHTGKPTNYKFEVWRGPDLLAEKTVQLTGNSYEHVDVYLPAQTSSDPEEPGDPVQTGTVQVADLVGSSKAVRQSWNATVTATIRDQDGNLVAAAAVSGRWLVNGNELAAYCETDLTGMCSITLSKIDRGIEYVEFVVTDVFVEGHLFDSANSVIYVKIAK